MKLLKKMRYIFSILLVASLLFSVTPVVQGFIAYEQYNFSPLYSGVEGA